MSAFERSGDELAAIIADIEGNWAPAELAEHRARLARLNRAIEVYGIDVAVAVMQLAIQATTETGERFTVVLDRALEALEHL